MATSSRTAPMPSARAALSWAVVALIALGGLAVAGLGAPEPADRPAGRGGAVLRARAASSPADAGQPVPQLVDLGRVRARRSRRWSTWARRPAIVVQLGAGLVLCVTPYVKPRAEDALQRRARCRCRPRWPGLVYAALGGPVGAEPTSRWALVPPALVATAAFVAAQHGLRWRS